MLVHVPCSLSCHQVVAFSYIADIPSPSPSATVSSNFGECSTFVSLNMHVVCLHVSADVLICAQYCMYM